MGNTPSATGQEEIIIMNDINEIVKHFTKESMIVWHDPNVYSPENTTYLEELKTLSHIQIFKDWKEASVCLKDSRVPPCQIITSGTNGELLVQEVSSLPNVSSIYIFCGNVEYHKTWAGEYTKVICVENDFKEVLKKIKRNTITWQRTSSSLRVDLPSFAPIFDDMDLSDINYLHFYLQGLINFKSRQQAKKDFITLAKALYGSNKFIDLFEKEYNEYNLKTILNWYTKECFLYKLTNNCLRIAKSDSIQYCRLILKDLEAAIKDKYKLHSRKFAGLLYRGAYISQEEWVRIQQNISRDIEMHGFLSTTKQRKVALHFCKQDADKKAMITIIVPNAPEKGVQGFAELKEYTDFPEEDEVLFNVRSRFTVLEAISEEIEGVKMRHLVLLYGAQAMRKFTTIQKPVVKLEISNSPALECRACKQAIIMASVPMIALNICDNQEYVCKDCLKKYDITSRKLFLCIFPSVHVLPNLLENDKKKKGISLEIEGTVMQTQQSLDIPFYGYRCRACSTPKPSRCYFKCLQCKEDAGVSYCNSCFFGKQDNKCIKEKHLIVAEGSPYSFWSARLSGKELEHLKYQEDQFSETNHIFQQAEIFYQTHNYAKAVEYYEKYLEKNSKSKNRHTANAYNNLALAYEGLGEYQKAVEYHFKALEIKEVVLGKKHADVATSYSNLGTTYHQLDDYQKAVEYNSKALEIRMAVLGDKHPDTAACYNNLGLAYDSLKEYEKAIEYYSKDLEIIKAVFGDNHPDNATSYNNIGLAYDSLGAFQNAVDHHLKALEIKKAAFGDKHPSTATSYNNLGLAYESLGEYPKAVEYYTKALEIKKAVFGDQHPSTITSSENLAAVKKMQSSSSNIGKRRRKKPVKDSPEKVA